MKKLIPAICMLLIAMTMLGASTYAWFSMNAKVTVTGMEVYTKVPSNLYVSPVDGENGKTNTDFTTTVGSNFATQEISIFEKTLLEPVSTIDGINFYFTDTSKVKADGDTFDEKHFTLYSAETSDAFNTAYNTVKASPYVDYVIMLQATNTTTSVQTVDLTNVNLTYGGNNGVNATKSFRTAIFVQDVDIDGNPVIGDANVDGNPVIDTLTGNRTTPTLLSILIPSNSDGYFTPNNAVSSIDSLSEVNQLSESVTIGNVNIDETKYFKVTVRLWIEGEDRVCNNNTFANLNESWALDLSFEFNGEATSEITQTFSTFNVIFGTESDKEDGSVISQFVGEAEYYRYTINSVEYWSEDAIVDATTKFYTIVGNAVYDVSNQSVIIVNYIENLTNVVSSKLDSSVDVNKDFVVKFKSDENYALPDEITVSIADVETSNFEWNKSTGTLIITASNINGDIKISVVADAV